MEFILEHKACCTTTASSHDPGFCADKTERLQVVNTSSLSFVQHKTGRQPLHREVWRHPRCGSVPLRFHGAPLTKASTSGPHPFRLEEASPPYLAYSSTLLAMQPSLWEYVPCHIPPGAVLVPIRGFVLKNADNTDNSLSTARTNQYSTSTLTREQCYKKVINLRLYARSLW